MRAVLFIALFCMSLHHAQSHGLSHAKSHALSHPQSDAHSHAQSHSQSHAKSRCLGQMPKDPNKTDLSYAVLALTWVPGFVSATATARLSKGEPMLSIHGFWPQQSGDYESHYPLYGCRNYSASQVSKILAQNTDPNFLSNMNLYWFSANTAASWDDSGNADFNFWSHELSKHGSCFPLQALNWFQLVLNLGSSILKTVMTKKPSLNVASSADDVYDAIMTVDGLRKNKSSVYLHCMSGSLYEIEILYTLGPNCKWVPAPFRGTAPSACALSKGDSAHHREDL